MKKRVPQLYLASASPRRRTLLEQIGVDFQTLSMAVDESRQPGEAVDDYVLRLAVDKARAGWQSLSVTARRPVLGADTLVLLDEEPLGKPENREQGLAMLSALAGRSHEVLTAVAVFSPEPQLCLNRSRVWMRASSAAERDAYWQTGEPLDKAGAYAIQGLGAIFVEQIQGSYSGVMGLPLFETAALLRQAGIELLPGSNRYAP